VIRQLQFLDEILHGCDSWLLGFVSFDIPNLSTFLANRSRYDLLTFTNFRHGRAMPIGDFPESVIGGIPGGLQVDTDKVLVVTQHRDPGKKQKNYGIVHFGYSWIRAGLST
jgi:hypothetical protein